MQKAAAAWAFSVVPLGVAVHHFFMGTMALGHGFPLSQ
jgi:hypothetical protein